MKLELESRFCKFCSAEPDPSDAVLDLRLPSGDPEMSAECGEWDPPNALDNILKIKIIFREIFIFTILLM